MTRKVIITGATGFLGRNIAETFHREGIEVIAGGRSSAVGEELRKAGIDFRRADILDMQRLNRAFDHADCVIHCAGKSGPWGAFKDFYAANVLGTRNVLQACRNHDIERIVFISTPSVYFTGRERFDVAESDPLPKKQMTNYARSKLIAENELLELEPEGFKVIMFRPRALYGPYENTFLPRIARMAEKSRFPLINNGRALIDITYVENFLDALRNALGAPDDAWNQVYNVCNGEPISVRDWFGHMLTMLDRPFHPKNVPERQAKAMATVLEFVGSLPFVDREPRITRFSTAYLGRSLTMSIDKAKAKLNYAPKIGNSEGFERYAEWRRAHEQAPT